MLNYPEKCKIYLIEANGILGLRPGSDFLDHYYTFGRRNRVHAGFHPHYIKFVEDAMLVLFLFCVMITLLVVHRASCYR